MGNDFFPVREGVQAGNILAIAGFSEYVFKTGTLMGKKERRILSPMTYQSAGEWERKKERKKEFIRFFSALLRVSVEPNDPKNWEKLQNGLKILNRIDPVVEVRVQPSGKERKKERKKEIIIAIRRVYHICYWRIAFREMFERFER